MQKTIHSFLAVFFLITLVLGLNAAPAPIRQQTNPGSCHWELVSDQEHIATAAPGATASRSSNNSIVTSYPHEGYMGCGDQILTTTHTWSEPATRLTPGSTVVFDVLAGWDVQGRVGCSSLTIGVNTYVTAGVTTIKAEIRKIILATEPDGSISNSGSWVVPAGSKPGEVLNITAGGNTGSGGGTVVYKYIYACEPTEEPEPSETEPKPTETNVPTATPDACNSEGTIGGDSGARFSDFSGEVVVYHCKTPDDAYPAEMDMVIERGVYIRTEGDSYAIISFADMTVFHMKPFTLVFIEYVKKETKLQLLAGKIWTNLKKWSKDGVITVETRQAVAGTKGTTFVMEANDQVSTLKVIEGAMSFTSLATGNTVEVTGGQMVSANDSGMTAVTPFDAAQESAAWPKTEKNTGDPVTQPSATGAEQPAGIFDNRILATLLFLAAGLACLLLLGIVIVAAILITRRRRSS